MYVLAADGDPTMCKAIKFILEGDGHEVVTACSGSEAVQSMNIRQPDVFILDMGLPDVDCFKIAELLRQEGSDAPVLFLVPRNDTFRPFEKLSIRFGEFMTKPFEPDQLIAAVRRLQEQWRQRPPMLAQRDRIAVGDLELRPSRSRIVIHDGNLSRIVFLAPFEVELAGCLMSFAGSEVSTERLVRTLRPGSDLGEAAEAVDRCVRKLQSKIEEDGEHPRYLEVLQGRRYRVRLPDEIAN